MVETLGMAKLLQEKKCWEYPPIPTFKEEDMREVDLRGDDNEDDSDAETLVGDEVIPQLLEEANTDQDADDIATGIVELTKVGVIDKGLDDHLTSLHKSAFKRLPSAGLPIYDVDEARKSTKAKFSPFVEICHNGKSAHIHKTTAIWLLQEGERVSSDRLFRVRVKQPFSSTTKHQPQPGSLTNTQPVVCTTIHVGDVCVFMASQEEWRLGRILQFSYFKEKTKKLSSIQEAVSTFL